MNTKDFKTINELWNIYDSANLLSKKTNNNLKKQQEYNASTVRILNEMHILIHKLIKENKELKKVINNNKQEINNNKQEINNNKQEINNNNKEINSLLNWHNSIIKPIKNFEQINYLQFENQFRGSEELIKKRQQIYLNYFKKCKNVLDIGCGRGEFLELCKKDNIKCYGVEIDGNMYSYCKNKKLNVLHKDIFKHLQKIKNNSLDGVFMAQIIEHFEFIDIQKLLFLLKKKMKKESTLIIETINPLCQQALNHFYNDLDHKKPLYPEILAHISGAYNFGFKEFIFKTPINNKLADNSKDSNKSDKYGDYAIILKKN